jgi:DNA-binding MarR family transcriptional regulator
VPRRRAAGQADFPTRFARAEQSPGFVLWQVATLWQRAVRDALSPLALTQAQFALLASVAWLASRGDDAPVTQTRIAEHARTDAVMTSEVLRTLERKGLVAREPHPTDARARHVVLTPDGRATVRRALLAVEAADAAFFGEPGPELHALAGLLAPLGAAR